MGRRESIRKWIRRRHQQSLHLLEIVDRYLDDIRRTYVEHRARVDAVEIIDQARSLIGGASVLFQGSAEWLDTGQMPGEAYHADAGDGGQAPGT